MRGGFKVSVQPPIFQTSCHTGTLRRIHPEERRMDTRGTQQAFWNDHIRAWRESGLAQGDYCARHGLKVGSLGY